MLSIEQAAYAIPEQRLSIEESSDWLGLTNEQVKIYKRIFGIDRFPVAVNTTLKDLIHQSMDKLLDNGKDVSAIKLIIHAHTAQVLCPFGKSLVNDIRREYGLHNAIYFGTSLNNCASILNAFEIASHFLNEAAPEDNALILVGDVTFTQALRVVPYVSITGDAAAAVLVNNHGPMHRLIALSSCCYGEYAKGLWLSHAERLDLENKFLTMLQNLISKTLHTANIRMEDVALILPHNVNTHIWHEIGKTLKISPSQIFIENIMKYAHCFGADLIMNFVDATKNNNYLKKGDYYLMVIAGLGINIGVALFQY